MQAGQMKKAPEKAASSAQAAYSAGAPEKKKGAKDKLYDLPRAAGIALMCLMLAAALFAGNFRALQIATPKDFYKQGDVASILEDRVAQAGNAVTVARRAGLSETDITAVVNACDALEDARSARDISRANQALDEAVSSLTTAQLSGENATSMLAAADNFAEQGSFLRQEARSYNEKALKAQELYDGLPTRFILPEPDVYEGL